MRLTDRFRQHTLPGAVAAGLMLAGAAWASAVPFEFSAVGSFKRMSHTGDTRGQIKLAELPQGTGNWGVGALAGLTGEVLLHDGRLLVSRGEDHAGKMTAARPEDEAVLFASARVQQWRDIPLTKDMSQAEFEAFVVEQARAHGLNPDQPFPFLVEGRFPVMTWHVVTGQVPRSGHGGGQHGGGHANKHAGMKVFEQPGAAGRLVAFYSGAQYEGVVSHPGERFHLHYVDESLGASGHVDAYGVAAGAVLKVPLK